MSARIRMQESKAEMMLPLGIALILAVLTLLNLNGVQLGRTLTWILQPLMLIAGGFVTASQVFVVKYVEAAAEKEATTAEQDQLKTTLAECDKKIARCRATLDAAGDPALIAGWIK